MDKTELRIKIAELLGWTDIRDDPFGEGLYGFLQDRQTSYLSDWTNTSRRPSYLSDWTNKIEDAYQLEDEIPEDQRPIYVKALYDLVKPDLTGIDFNNRDELDRANNNYTWSLIHATPEQRCRAWVAWREAVKQEAGE